MQMGLVCGSTVAGQPRPRSLGEHCGESWLLVAEWEHHIRGRASRHPCHSCVDIIAREARAMQMHTLPW